MSVSDSGDTVTLNCHRAVFNLCFAIAHGQNSTVGN
jgi:hypothetical protein